jgi:hypothetical protein
MLEKEEEQGEQEEEEMSSTGRAQFRFGPGLA